MEFYGLGFLYVAGNSFADEESLEKGFGGFVERESFLGGRLPVRLGVGVTVWLVFGLPLFRYWNRQWGR